MKFGWYYGIDKRNQKREQPILQDKNYSRVINYLTKSKLCI